MGKETTDSTVKSLVISDEYWERFKKRKVNFKQREETYRVIFYIVFITLYCSLFLIHRGIHVNALYWQILIILYSIFLIAQLPTMRVFRKNSVIYGSDPFDRAFRSNAIMIGGFLLAVIQYLIQGRVYWILVLLAWLTFMLNFRPQNALRAKDAPQSYPVIIASAERVTMGYMNGYSPRPVESKFPEFERIQMKQFITFLLDNVLIWKVEEKEEAITMLFPPRGWARLLISFWKTSSTITIHKSGRAEVFICPQDYKYLNVPISHHELAANVVRKMVESYKLLSQGKREKALKVFTIKLKRRKKRKTRRTDDITQGVGGEPTDRVNGETLADLGLKNDDDEGNFNEINAEKVVQ